MIVFPNAKINLGLRIRSRRKDGYHNIETIFLPVGLKDILEVVPSDSKEITLKVTGLEIDAPMESNLTWKAAKLMQDTYSLSGVNMHLHKVIPMGAGLGGGSADASFTIALLDRIFELGLDKETLKIHAASLGSDCPYFIENTPMLGEGTGGELTPVEIPGLSGLKIVIVKPDIHISTAEAYSGVNPDSQSPHLTNFLASDPALWKASFTNDFEDSIFPHHPQIKAIKETLYRNGAIYASMSGSGAAVFGFFKELPEAIGTLFSNHFVWCGDEII